MGNRHPDTWEINFYIKLQSEAGNFTTSFPLANLSILFSPHTFCQTTGKKNCSIFALISYSITTNYSSGDHCTEMCNNRLTHGHHSNIPLAYLCWFTPLITTEAEFVLFKVKCLGISSYVFYIGSLLGGILIYLIFLLNLALQNAVACRSLI